MIELIKNVHFYPKDLRITEEAWTNSLNILRKIDGQIYDDNKLFFDTSYAHYTNFEFVNQLELNIIAELKIDICKNTSKVCDKLAELETKNVALEKDNAELKKRVSKLEIGVCKKIWSFLKQHPILSTWIVGGVALGGIWIFRKHIESIIDSSFLGVIVAVIGIIITVVLSIRNKDEKKPN